MIGLFEPNCILEEKENEGTNEPLLTLKPGDDKERGTSVSMSENKIPLRQRFQTRGPPMMLVRTAIISKTF